MQGVLDEFIKRYNNGTLNIEETPFDKAMEKFSEAYEAKTEKMAIKLAKEAIKIDPDYIEPYLFIIPYEYEGEEVLTEMNKVLDREEKRLRKQGYFEDEGHFLWYMGNETIY